MRWWRGVVGVAWILLGGCNLGECESGRTRACTPDEPECRVATQRCSPSGRWGPCACVLWDTECWPGDTRVCEEDELMEGCCQGTTECTEERSWAECTCFDWCDSSTETDAPGDPAPDPADVVPDVEDVDGE